MPKRAKKKTEPEAPAETPVPQHEPDEPELNAASQAVPGSPPDVRVHDATSALPDEAIAEATAEAADTFEQAFEERQPLERRIALSPDLRISEESETEAKGPAEATPEPSQAEPEAEITPTERPPARLERLQKILSQAGVASRRHAEELITQGRVQVNGQVVTELGSKADPDRDHIRVDGKLLHGAERLRYFVLNKPRGYVTTVSDPEGRPTVIQFFKKMHERLYPVGRLDYQSEGLLLVTNDGDLANKLTKPASHVEKTYLVKVSGRPGPEELDRVRAGLGIDRTRPGEGRVQTAPAEVRLVRQGDNPWYEVVLTEGRNRELRKMFEEIGHHVEKIRRVGYGPLVLDVEPGQFRELEPEELAHLRLAAEGKWRKPKPRQAETRRQESSRPAGDRQKRSFSERPAERQKQWTREDRGGWRSGAPSTAKRQGRGPAKAPARPLDLEGPAGRQQSARPQQPARRQQPARGQQPSRWPQPARPQEPARGQQPARWQRSARPQQPARGQQPARRQQPATRDEDRQNRRENRPFGAGARRPPFPREDRQREGSRGRQRPESRPGFDRTRGGGFKGRPGRPSGPRPEPADTSSMPFRKRQPAKAQGRPAPSRQRSPQSPRPPDRRTPPQGRANRPRGPREKRH